MLVLLEPRSSDSKPILFSETIQIQVLTSPKFMLSVRMVFSLRVPKSSTSTSACARDFSGLGLLDPLTWRMSGPWRMTSGSAEKPKAPNPKKKKLVGNPVMLKMVIFSGSPNDGSLGRNSEEVLQGGLGLGGDLGGGK